MNPIVAHHSISRPLAILHIHNSNYSNHQMVKINSKGIMVCFHLGTVHVYTNSITTGKGCGKNTFSLKVLSFYIATNKLTKVLLLYQNTTKHNSPLNLCKIIL